MKMLKIGLAVCLAFAAQSVVAQQFNSGIPVGWTTTGVSGTSGADGVVGLAPGGGTAYGWVSTAGSSAFGLGLGIGSETNGSLLRSTAFAASAFDPLNFSFNYVTSDGAGYIEYAWSRLLNAGDLSTAALLFTARTTPSGDTVPGFGLPPTTPGVTLVPASTPIIGGGPAWSPLGGSSGACWSAGCGYTGWIAASYLIPTAGSYILEFGVVNWADTAFDSGLAFDGITVAGTPVGVVPEPETYAMLLAGLGLLGFAARRRKQKLATA